MAMLLHYFLLTTFVWSFIAGYQIYILLVVIFDSSSERSSRMLRYKILAYGVPAVAIALTFVIDKYAYQGETYYTPSPVSPSNKLGCWMSPNALYITMFFTPVVLMLTINMGMMCIAMARVYHITPRPQLFSQARGLLSLLFILGGTWMAAIIYNNAFPSSIFLLYLSTILNSLQGVFIFVFYVLLGENFRKSALRMFSSNGEEKFTTILGSLGIRQYGCKPGSEIPQAGNYNTSGEDRRKSGSVKDIGMSTSERSEEIENEGLIVSDFQYNQKNSSSSNDQSTKTAGNL